MKTLGKLIINDEKTLSNEELKSLHGGEYWQCAIFCPGNPPIIGPGGGSDCSVVIEVCNNLWNQAGCYCDCNC